jgi:hypothetical protein
MSVGGNVDSDCTGYVIATDNKLGADGAAWIATGMQSCPNITSLNLGGSDCCVLCCMRWAYERVCAIVPVWMLIQLYDTVHERLW